MDKLLEASKADEVIVKMLLRSDEFLTSISTLFQTKSMDAITDQRRIGRLEFMSMECSAKMDAAAEAEASFAKEATKCTSSESSRVESYRGPRPRRALLVLAVAGVGTEIKPQSHQTQHCQWETLTPGRNLDASVT